MHVVTLLALLKAVDRKDGLVGQKWACFLKPGPDEVYPYFQNHHFRLCCLSAGTLGAAVRAAVGVATTLGVVARSVAGGAATLGGAGVSSLVGMVS